MFNREDKIIAAATLLLFVLFIFVITNTKQQSKRYGVEHRRRGSVSSINKRAQIY